MVDSATVVERTCSVAYSAIVKSNCRMELTYPLAYACTTTGKAVWKVYNESALLAHRVSHRVRNFTFKALNKQAPTYLTDLLISYTPSRSLRSSSKNLLKIPMYNLKSYGGRSFALASAVLWNSLPQSLRDLQSVETFKRKLKKHLFLQAYMEH